MLERRSLRSIKQQRFYGHIQVIVICDGVKAPSYMLEKFKWVKWVEIPKKQHYPENAKLGWLVGPSNALNKGLKLVKGNYIARMDDEDIWRPDMLQTMVNFLREHDYEFVSAAAKGPNGIIPPYKHPLVGSVQTWLYESYLGCFKYNLGSWRKSWDCNNEIDLYKRMHDAGVRFGYLPCVVCDILPRPGLKEIGSKAWLKETEPLQLSQPEAEAKG